jgi:hypothetical protein
MIGWNPILQRHITEHPRLQLLIVSSHPCFLPHLHCGWAVVFQQPPKPYQEPIGSVLRPILGFG